MGWETDALFTVKDIFTTSEAESNKNKYLQVVNDLENELTKIAAKLKTATDTITKNQTSMMGNGDTSLGKMINDFETKRDENKRNMDKLISYYRLMETNVENKRSLAQMEYYKWSGIAKTEDAQKKEYVEAQNEQ